MEQHAGKSSPHPPGLFPTSSGLIGTEGSVRNGSARNRSRHGGNNYFKDMSCVENGESSSSGKESESGMRRASSAVIISVGADSSHHGENNFKNFSSQHGGKQYYAFEAVLPSSGAPAEAPEKPPEEPSSTNRDQSPTQPSLILLRLKDYFSRWSGGHDTRLPIPPVIDLVLAFVGSFLAILLVMGLDKALSGGAHLPVLVASFGASAVLIFGAIESKLAQPRNFIGGQIISAVIGCAVRAAFGPDSHNLTWLSAPIGMSLSLLAMQLTATTHPPGGATALIAASAENVRPWAGFQFVITVIIGTLAMQLVALIVNNLHQQRRYPRYWLG